MATSTPDTEAARFLAALQSSPSLSQAYFDAFTGPDGQMASPAQVTSWIQSQGYKTTMADVLSAQNNAHNNTLAPWNGVYNTQLEGAIGPRIVINGNAITVNGVTINGATVSDGVLSWSDGSNDSNAQLNFHPMTGLAPSLDPQLAQSQSSTSNAEPATEPSGESSAMIPNAYVGPQFTGFFWATGWQKPIQINIQGRQGKFPVPGTLPPSSNANSTSTTGQANEGSISTPVSTTASVPQNVGPLQASTLDQWASSYDVWVSTPSGLIQSDSDTFVIDTSGNLTVNGVRIIKPVFTNDVLSWDANDGNSSNGYFTMQDHTSAGKSSLVDGDQFTGRYWTQGQTEPTTDNWFGFAEPDDNSDSSSPTSSVAGSDATSPTVTKATQSMNVWVSLKSLGLEAIHTYMMFKLGEMIMKGVGKVLLYAWKALRWACRKIRQWYRNMRNNQPPGDANNDGGPRSADEEENNQQNDNNVGDNTRNVNNADNSARNPSNGGGDAQNAGEQDSNAAVKQNAGSQEADSQPESIEVEMAEIQKKEEALLNEARDAALQKKAAENEAKKIEEDTKLDKEAQNRGETGDESKGTDDATTGDAAASDAATTGETLGEELVTSLEGVAVVAA